MSSVSGKLIDGMNVRIVSSFPAWPLLLDSSVSPQNWKILRFLDSRFQTLSEFFFVGIIITDYMAIYKEIFKYCQNV